MRKHLLVVGAQDSTVAKAAVDADVTLFQVKRLITQKQIASAQRTFIFGVESLQETLCLARAVHGYKPFHAVISYLDAGMLPAAVVTEDLGLPGNRVQPVSLTFDKLEMRELLQERGVGTVPFRRCDTPADVESFLAKVAGPIVLKPSCSSGGVGVIKVDQDSDVLAAFEHTRGMSDKSLIAESYIEGADYSVESISINGKHQIVAISEKITDGGRHFIAVGHRLPASISEATTQRIEGLTQQFLDLIGLQMGPAHTEIRIDSSGEPLIIESHTRSGGGQICEMVELVYGIDLHRASYAHLLELPVSPVPIKAPAAAIGFLTHQHKTVRAVRGVEQAMAVPGVLRVDCRLYTGQRIGALASARDRQGYVIAVGDRPETAWAAVQEALSKIAVEE